MAIMIDDTRRTITLVYDDGRWPDRSLISLSQNSLFRRYSRILATLFYRDREINLWTSSVIRLFVFGLSRKGHFERCFFNIFGSKSHFFIDLK